MPAVETPPSAALTRGQLALAMVLLASINAFGFIDRVIIALVAEKIKAEFFLSDLQIGLLGGTAFAVVNAFASVPIARMAERISRATVTAGFLLLASLFTALAGVTSLLVLQSLSGKSRLALVVIEVQRTLTLDDPTFVEGLRESIMGKLHGVSCKFGTLAEVKSLQCSGASPEDQSVKMTMTAVVANGYGYVLTAVGPEREIATPEATGFFNSFSFIGPPAEHHSTGTDATGRPLPPPSDDFPIGSVLLKYLVPLLGVVGLGYIISAVSARNERRKQQG